MKRHVSICVFAMVFFVPAASAQEDFVGSVEYDPAKITPAMKAETETIAKALDDLTPKGWKQTTLIERYTPVNLYDKINGRSELYNQYNVRGMTFVTFTHPDDPAWYIDLFLYDMRTSPGAFGVYSVERWGDNPSLDIGSGAYRTDRDFFFWKGPYYATVLGGTDDDVVQDAVTVVAETLVKRLEDDDVDVWGLDVLPKKNLTPNSIKYFMVDALSLDFLGDTFTGAYTIGETDYTGFVSKQKSETDCAEVLSKFKQYTEKYGKDGATGKIPDTDLGIIYANMGGGYYDAMFQIGHYICGITGGEGPEITLRAAAELAAGVSKAVDDR